MIQRLEAEGSPGQVWDDGFNHDDVTKIYIRSGISAIEYIYFDYVKSGKSIEGSRHGSLSFSSSYGYTTMIEINHLENEHLESVFGSYDQTDGLQYLLFKSNFRTFEPIQVMRDTRYERRPPRKGFSLAVQGKKIVGFHGSSESYTVKTLGAYFTSIPPTKVEAKGGDGGKAWDDGYDHENVSKIHVRAGFEGIQSIQFEYVKNGQIKKGSLRGVSSRGFTVTHEINYLSDEYVVSVEGYYDDTSRVIQGIQFRTNIRIFDMIGYDNGRKFSVASKGKKIIGFHGYAGQSLISIGAYFAASPCKLELVGNGYGINWDDGSNYDGIRKVFVDEARWSINCIRFEYDYKGKAEKTRRANLDNETEFVLDYPNEFITSVEGTTSSSKIKSLTIKTSKGRTSPTFGEVAGEKFVLEKQGSALIGFYGIDDVSGLCGLGAYYRPLPPPSDAQKLEPQGGDGGDSWDDGGSFNSIKKIYLGLTGNAISFVKFMYVKGNHMVLGDDHGSKTLLSDVQEFELDFPLEYLISVEGNYDERSGVITMLRFKTNKDNRRTFGVDTESSFELHENGHRIVGFYGISSNVLHQIGVYVHPTNS